MHVNISRCVNRVAYKGILHSNPSARPIQSPQNKKKKPADKTTSDSRTGSHQSQSRRSTDSIHFSICRFTVEGLGLS